MFKDVQCEHHWSHDTHQADCLILAQRVHALHCTGIQNFGDLMFEVVLGVFEDADSENVVRFGVYGLA